MVFAECPIYRVFSSLGSSTKGLKLNFATEPCKPLVGPRLLTGFHQLNKLGDPLGTQIRTAFRRINPPQVVFPVEGRQSVKEPRGVWFDRECVGNVSSQSVALGTFRHQHHGDRIPQLQTAPRRYAGPSGRKYPLLNCSSANEL